MRGSSRHELSASRKVFSQRVINVSYHAHSHTVSLTEPAQEAADTTEQQQDALSMSALLWQDVWGPGTRWLRNNPGRCRPERLRTDELGLFF